MKKAFFFFVMLIFFSTRLLPQTIINPNYALKSHETLQIIKIELKPEATMFYMTIENRIKGGSFCADRNIYVIYSDGRKTKLLSASGIPVCPDTHKFRSPGEKLDFVLTFPPLRRMPGPIDLIEECNDNCFSFYGVILDADLNKRIDEAFTLAENDEPTKSLISFISIAEDIEKNKQEIPTLFYMNIIKLATETGNGTKAEEWYRKLKLSKISGLSRYIKFLTDLGIIY